MFAVLALAITLACVAASLRRLALVHSATTLDLDRLLVWLRLRESPSTLASSARALGEMLSSPDAECERELMEALAHPASQRDGLLGEAMTEFEHRVGRWGRVPRVMASLSSSFGFLLATVCLRTGLAGLVGQFDDSGVGAVNGAVLDAVDVGAIGLAGATVCVAIQFRVRSASVSQRSAVMHLIDWIEQASSPTTGTFPERSTHDSVPFAAVESPTPPPR